SGPRSESPRPGCSRQEYKARSFQMRTSLGRVGIERRFSIVPRSRSRVMARPVIITIVMVNHAHETRNDVVLRNNFGIVGRVDAKFDWPACRTERSKRSFQIVLQGYIKKRWQRAESDSRGGRISRVRLDQQCRTIAAQEIAAEIFRNVDHKLYVTAG